MAEELCPYGYVVFSVNYRLSSRSDGTWPAQIEDVQKALRYISANSRQLRSTPPGSRPSAFPPADTWATMVALRHDPAGPDGRVSVAINLDGEHDMTMPPDRVMADFHDVLTAVMGHGPPWSDAELRDISTVTFARPDVSLLTIHGAGDDNVCVTQGERITEVLRARGAETEFVRIEGREGDCHEDCWRVPRARRALHDFLDRPAHDGDRSFEATASSTVPPRR